MEVITYYLNAVAIGISQQGTSTGVIACMDQIRKKGICVLAMTGEYETEITRHGDAVLYIECGPEDAGATTKGFSATVFTLLLLGKQMAEQCKGPSDKCNNFNPESILCTLENNSLLNKKSPVFMEMIKILTESKDLMIISDETYRDLLPEIVLKFSETCRFPVRGYPSEEFMHGMYNAVNIHTDFLMIAARMDENIKKLSEYYKAKGCHVLFLFEENLFVLVAAVQTLFVMVSRKRGIDLNIPRDPNFHKIMGSKIENIESTK